MNYVVVTAFNHVHVYVVPRRAQFKTTEEFRGFVSFTFKEFLHELPTRQGIPNALTSLEFRAVVHSSILGNQSYQDYLETLLEGQ